MKDSCCGNCKSWGLMKSGQHFKVDELSPNKLCSVVGVFVAPDFAGPKCQKWERNFYAPVAQCAKEVRHEA